MPHRTGWFPAKRDDIIHMADAWSVQMGLHGPAWGIPPERITGFQDRLAGIKPLFAEVKSAGRNSVNTEQCRIMFRELELDMQFIKANYFNSPPRTPDELIALLLSVHSGSWTPILPAAVVPGLSLHNTDGHGMLVKLFMDAVPSDRRGADHFFCKWGLKPAGRWATPEEAAADPRLLTRPPAQAADLPMHFSTSRKWHELPFGLADLRLELFVTACWQTPRNQDGPYCPIVSRLIA
ncbi:MAG: hypothetical protein LBD08_03175 [Treponema sp.]|nr:hypothetical protein [Treponema sp.]